MTNPEERPPNLLMIMADQLSASALGCYGHPVVRTPNIDRLAQRGVLFETAYCNSPLCGPSRASMVSGRLPIEIGAFDNASEFPASQPTFMHELRLAGYQTILAGKMHFVGPDQLHGFEERLTTDIYPAGFDWTGDWDRGIHGNPGTCVEHLGDSGPCAAGSQIDYDEEVLFRAREKLRDLSRAEDDRPFFLCASFTHPHDLFYSTPEYYDLYTDDEIPPPSAPAETLDAMHPFNRWISIHHRIDEFPPSEETVRRARRAYYGMVTYFDAQVGKLLDDLELLGLRDNTIILITSDHGEMLGEHGMWFKRTYYEDAMRVPMIWSGPNITQNKSIPQVVSLIDLYPTLADIANGAPKTAFEGAAGQSLRPLLENTETDPKDSAIGEYYGEGAIAPMRLIRRGPWKYVHVHGESSLLFNLQDDPNEQNNRAGDSTVSETEQNLRNALLENWDGEAIRQRIVDDQRRRRKIHQALSLGKTAPWDYTPDFDGRQRYVRKLDAQATTMQKLKRPKNRP